MFWLNFNYKESRTSLEHPPTQKRLHKHPRIPIGSEKNICMGGVGLMNFHSSKACISFLKIPKDIFIPVRDPWTSPTQRSTVFWFLYYIFVKTKLKINKKNKKKYFIFKASSRSWEK